MNIISQVRSMMSGQTREEFGLGERHPLTSAMKKSIRRHVLSLHRADLNGYEFERRPSSQRHAKSDIVVYDGAQKQVLFGRDMDGAMSFWEQTK